MHESTLKWKIYSFGNINEVPEVAFPVNFKITYLHQQKVLGLLTKLKCAIYKTRFFMQARILKNFQ